MKIDSYDFGSIVIEGKTYTNDIIVSAEGVKPDWWRKQGHSLAVEDLSDVLNKDFEVIVIGSGHSGIMKVPSETRRYIESMGIEMIVQNTSEAVNTYNKLLEEKRKVVGAFHLTC